MKDISIAINAFIQWKPIREEVIRLKQEGKVAEAEAITMGKGADHVTSLVSKIQTMIDYANEKGDSYYEQAKLVKSTTEKTRLYYYPLLFYLVY